MADNYLERQYEDYLAGKAAREKGRRLKWQKQLKAYKEKIDAEKKAKSRLENLQPKKDNGGMK